MLPELNAATGVWPESLMVEADVRDMPGVWLSADHQARPPHWITCLGLQPLPSTHDLDQLASVFS